MNVSFWQRLWDQERGFTLLEVVLAIFIVGTAVVGSVVVMGAAVRSAGSSTGSLDLQQLVQAQIETIQQVPFSATGDYPRVADQDIPEGTSLSFQTEDTGTRYQFPSPDNELITEIIQKIDVTAANQENSVTMSFYKISIP